MWTREELKSRAKLMMKGRYWTYLGVSLLPVLASYVVNIPISIIYQVLTFSTMMGSFFGGSGTGGIFNRLVDLSPEGIEEFMNSFTQSDLDVMMKGLIVPYIFIITAMFLVSVFLMLPLQVGITRWYVRAREGSAIKANLCFSPFTKGSFLPTAWSMFYYQFWLNVFYFLFFVPGLIKSYSYSMIPYILADNPRIGTKRALKLSSRMTSGHKLDMFVLDVSFAGWMLLGFLACCIGVYGVIPYYLATKAELYDTLKKDAVGNGLCTMEELGYVPMSKVVENPVPGIDSGEAAPAEITL
ncbi:MAG: DUF975 family protein [Saccharofermentanales bacterium]